MSAEVIQAEYETLKAIASRFMRQAELTQQMENKLRSQADSLTQTGWEGRGAEAFRQEMESTVLPAWQRLHGALEASHQTTLEITHILRTAEEEAATLFGSGTEGHSINSSPTTPENKPETPPTDTAYTPTNKESKDLTVVDPHAIFDQEHMKDSIGNTISGQDSAELNDSMEKLFDYMRKTSIEGETYDKAVIDPLLEKIAEARGIDATELKEQFPKFINLWENTQNGPNGSTPDINLNKYPDYLGSTWSLRSGEQIGTVFGIDPVLGALLNPTGGLVGEGSDSIEVSANDSVGYHGVFHDAGGYLYNYHGEIGPGYNYLGGISSSNPLSGHGAIAWWAWQTQDIPFDNPQQIVDLGKIAADKIGDAASAGISIINTGIQSIWQRL